jgi:hypothetical protein
MVRSRALSRRRFVVATAGAVVASASAGCADRGADGAAGESGGETDTDESDDEAGDSGGEGGDSDDADADLDLREANVVDVAVEPTDDGYAFDVTLHHDDDGEEGYANWWQVERLDGTRLGRRELLHAHAEQPFTRSATVAVPDDVTCVVVRGHDQTHGYGGVAAAVDLDAGTARRVDQGPDPRSFGEADCP